MTEKHENLLVAYFTNQITDIERSEILTLLDTDSEFASSYREMEKAYISACIPVYEKTKAKNYKILERRLKSNTRTTYFWKPFAIAASIAALLLLGTSLYTGYKFHDAECFICQSDVMTVTAKNGTGTETQLPDGTRVCLNAESSLSFNRHFGRGSRDVTLEGEGYFMVTSDAARPFRVHTSNTCVTVKGTTFNVRSYSDEQETTVSLIEGSVVLNTNLDEAILTPGQCAVISRDDNKISTKTADPFATDWINGRIVFTDKTIPEILRSIERNYGVRFIYADDLFEGERFTGNISYRLSVDEVLSYIDVDNKYKWRKSDDTIAIYRK